MRHEVGIFTFSEWVWVAAILFIACVVLGFIIYKVTHNGKDKDNATKILEEETEMAEIWCPNLLTETKELREEVTRYRQSLGQQSKNIL